MPRRLIEVLSFKRERGYCWVASLPDGLKRGDVAACIPSSELMLFEDGNSLGPARAEHDLIRGSGQGAFSHWDQELWFSTSDNTPPTSNGRRYAVVADDFQEELASAPFLPVIGASTPVNRQPLDASPAAIETDAKYALAIAQSYVDSLPGGQPFLSGRSILELGPGHNFGSALVLLCWGASRMAVADRFLVSFDMEYHVPLYQRLEALLTESDKAVSLDPVREVINRGVHKASGLTAYASSLEQLPEVVGTTFDVTLSTAVFEHLFNPRAAICSLYHLMTSGGIGLHQVDFRDHRDFSRPLEFLLNDERSFALIFEKELGQLGNRIRPFQMKAMFLEAGFGRVDLNANLLADKKYLEEFISRLRSSVASPFCEMDMKHLYLLGGRFVVWK